MKNFTELNAEEAKSVLGGARAMPVRGGGFVGELRRLADHIIASLFGPQKPQNY
jgi:hypothetical protein